MLTRTVATSVVTILSAVACTLAGPAPATTRAADRAVAAAWDELVAALRAADEPKLRRVAADGVIAELTRGTSDAAERAAALAAIGRHLAVADRRVQVQSPDRCVFLVGPEIKEAGFTFVRGEDGWKLANFSRGR